MLPVIHLFGLSVSAYLLMASLACAVFWLFFARAVRRDVPGRARLLLPPAVILSAMIGARLLHAALNPGRYGPGYPVWSLRYERLSLMGGLVLGTLVLYAVCRELSLPFARVCDGMTPAAGSAMALLKAGCFLNGCCGGVPTESPFGVVFPSREAVYDLLNTPAAARKVWPVQLFECLAYLLGIALLLLLAEKIRLPEGGRFLSYAVYAAAVRLALHPLRAYAGTTAKTFHSVFYPVLLAVSAALLIRQIRRSRKNGAASF